MRNERKQPTIYDISELTGVSIATVSRVINGSSKVSEKTRSRVLAAIEEVGYEPNAYARGLGTGKTRTIGILCADLQDTFLANAVSYLERDLKQHGFIPILSCTGYHYEEKEEGLREMLGRKVDAVILVGSQYQELHPAKNGYILEASREIPIMTMNADIRGENIYCSLVDDRRAYLEATKLLIEDGRRRILFLYRERTASEDRKFHGYREALEEMGVPYDESLVLGINERINATRRAIAAEWEEGLRFDAVITSEDEPALAVLKFAKSINIRVPEELAIIGCNNSILSICPEPELTTVDNKCEMLCVNIVSTLMMALQGKSVSRRSVLETDLIERGTTAFGKAEGAAD